jgi:phage-related protein
MALACGYAAMPPDGKRLVGSADRLEREPTARVLICMYDGHLVALHGFLKKTRTTPKSELSLARSRQKEMER